MDIFNGVVVHAVRGERSRYLPVDRHSRIVTTSDPLSVIQAVRPKEVYLADLNLLTDSGDNLEILDKISHLSKTMADIGASRLSHLECLPQSVVPVLGTETASLWLMKEAAQIQSVVVSVDIKRGRVLTSDPEMAQSPLEVIRRLNAVPLEGVIVLDLDRVGTSSGLDRDFLEKAASASDHVLILGGGVKDVGDLEALERLGFQGALMATAVHNGKIPIDLLR
jgi:phosphoribosylformimino-5-aminoimidazole carboxamide ribotide isomerase